MNDYDHDRILAFGPRSYEEAKFVCDEFAMAAHTCLAADNVSELIDALKRLDLVRPWLPAWLRYRDQEIERLARVAPPIMIRRNLSTPENREFWEGVDRAALEVATWPDWKVDRPRAAAETAVPKVDESQKCDHNKDTAE